MIEHLPEFLPAQIAVRIQHLESTHRKPFLRIYIIIKQCARCSMIVLALISYMYITRHTQSEYHWIKINSEMVLLTLAIS